MPKKNKKSKPSASRPERYTDPHGQVVYEGSRPTRVAPGKTLVYDGRMATKWTLFQQGQRSHIGNYRVSGHAIRELVKGLFLSKPDLFSAKADVLIMEVAYQCAKHSGYPEDEALYKWMDANRDMIATLCEVMQASLVGQAAAIMRNHDEDIKHELPEQWQDWRSVHKSAMEAQDLRDERKARTYWCRMAQQAKDRVDKANRIKALAPLVKTPKLAVTKTHNGMPLTSADVKAIDDDEVYASMAV